MKKIMRNVEIDFSKYYNEETGESLAQELIGNKKKMIEIREETDLVTLGMPKNFAVIDVDTLQKLFSILSNADLAQVLKIIPLTKTEMNMLFNHSVPHTNFTLQKYLDFSSRAKFTEMIRRLIKAGVLYELKGHINGAVRKVYILNPYLSNRRKTFHNSLFDLFKDFSE